MKKILLILTALLLLLVTGCGGQPQASQATPIHHAVEVTLTFSRRDGIATNQFAVWIEDGAGKLVKTLFVTRFTAKSGWRNRPEALPVWVEKSGISAENKADAHSGATPKSGRLSYVWDCTDESGQAVPDGDYTFLAEGTIFWQDAVTYTGTITIGGEQTSVAAEASYTTEEAQTSDMITDVTVVYTP